ncbi:MAG: hypothetical protein ACKVQT_29200 [Burkholderiales bacterium]
MPESKRHFMQTLAIALLVACLASCALEPSQRVRQERAERATQSINLQGFPPEYRQGFADGCAAVGTTAPPKPTGVPNFVQGWQDGFKHCTNRKPQ